MGSASKNGKCISLVIERFRIQNQRGEFHHIRNKRKKRERRENALNALSLKIFFIARILYKWRAFFFSQFALVVTTYFSVSSSKGYSPFYKLKIKYFYYLFGMFVVRSHQFLPLILLYQMF